MVVSRPEEFFLRLGRDQLIGFGEAYLTGAWDAEDLGGFLTVLAARMQHLIPEPLQKLRGAGRPQAAGRGDQQRGELARQHRAPLRPLQRAVPAVPRPDAELLLGAVHRRRARPADGGARPAPTSRSRRAARSSGCSTRPASATGSRVLEIGSGWGELAIRAARRGATVTHDHPVDRAEGAGRRADRGRRAVATGSRSSCATTATWPGQYDAVVSVEMVEAVGWQYWQTYFETIDRVLAPGGRVAIQAITMPHDRMLATRNTYTWINKYIFPGGFLPSVRVIDEITREHTTLRMAEPLSMGASYAETLRLWDEAFLAASERVRAPRLRRHLHADVALLPGVLARRLRVRLHRRQPADLHETDRVVDHRWLRRRSAPVSKPRNASWDSTRRRCDGSRRGSSTPCGRSSGRPPGAAEGVGRLGGRARRRAAGRRSTRADAVRRLLWRPGELGAAQAYVTGEIDVPGDLDHALTHAFAVARRCGGSPVGGRQCRACSARPAPFGGIGALRPPTGGSRVPGEAPRPPAQPAPRPQRDLVPLRPEQRVLLADPRAADGLLVRLPLLAGAAARGGAVRQAVAGLPQARPRAGHDAARRRLRLGLAVAARRRALRRAGHRHHDRGRAEALHRPADPRARPRGPGRRSSSATTATASASTTPSARSRWASTSGRTTTRRTPRSCSGR